jgi:capsid protein
MRVRIQPRWLVKLFLLDQYDDAELDRKKVAAMHALFITTPAPAEPLDAAERRDENDERTPLTARKPYRCQPRLSQRPRGMPPHVDLQPPARHRGQQMRQLPSPRSDHRRPSSVGRRLAPVS